MVLVTLDVLTLTTRWFLSWWFGNNVAFWKLRTNISLNLLRNWFYWLKIPIDSNFITSAHFERLCWVLALMIRISHFIKILSEHFATKCNLSDLSAARSHLGKCTLRQFMRHRRILNTQIKAKRRPNDAYFGWLSVFVHLISISTDKSEWNTADPTKATSCSFSQINWHIIINTTSSVKWLN